MQAVGPVGSLRWAHLARDRRSLRCQCPLYHNFEPRQNRQAVRTRGGGGISSRCYRVCCHHGDLGRAQDTPAPCWFVSLTCPLACVFCISVPNGHHFIQEKNRCARLVSFLCLVKIVNISTICTAVGVVPFLANKGTRMSCGGLVVHGSLVGSNRSNMN